MAKNNNISDLLKSVADAIRAKKGTTELINPQNFDAEIASIPSGKVEVMNVDLHRREEIISNYYLSQGVRLPYNGWSISGKIPIKHGDILYIHINTRDGQIPSSYTEVYDNADNYLYSVTQVAFSDGTTFKVSLLSGEGYLLFSGLSLSIVNLSVFAVSGDIKGIREI